MNQQNNFTTLLIQNRRLIYCVIGKYCSDEIEKEDIFQDVCLEAWKAYNTFSGKVKFGSWIGNIARNIAIDRLNKLKKLKVLLTNNFLWEIQDIPYEEPAPKLSFSIIDRLSEVEKRTLYFRMDGLTFAEISSITGEPINRLIIRMHRIKRMLSGKSKAT